MVFELVDSHCHLDFPDFAEELPQIIARAHDAGVKRMVTICTKLPNLPAVRAITAAYPGVFYAAGVHPMSVADHAPFSLGDLLALADDPKCVGIGETGLDYHYTADSARAQQAALRLHIQASQQTGLPLIIHARAADDDMARILREGMDLAPYTCVMHCFSSSAELAQAALDQLAILGAQGRVGFAQLALQKLGQCGLASKALAHHPGPAHHAHRGQQGERNVRPPLPAHGPPARQCP